MTTLGDRLRATATAAPDHIAFIDGTQHVTYAQWDRRADAAAAMFWDAGARPGDVIALMLDTVPAYPIAFLGAARIGCVTAGINPRLGAREVGLILDATNPRVVLSNRELDVRTIPVAALPDEGTPPTVAVGMDDPVAIVFTTGSTGDPKGATFSHRSLDAVARIEAQMDHEQNPVRLQSIPMAHMQFMTKVAMTIDQRATTVLLARWTAPGALAAIARHRVTSFGGIPTQLQLMIMDPSFATTDLSSLHSCTLGGAPATALQVEQFRDAFGAPIAVRYSCTELAVITGTRSDDAPSVVATTVGRPLPEVTVTILDAGDDGVGEVAARSDAMMTEYWGQEPLDRTQLFRTGDLGSIVAHGSLRLRGRRKEMYIRGGYNVYPVEVEQVLRAHPGVAMAAVAGIPDEVLGERGVAWVVPIDPDLSPDNLRAFIAEQIADYKVPDVIEFRDELPLNATFKVDKAALVRDA